MQIAEQVIGMIGDNTLPDGVQLPTSRQLAAALELRRKNVFVSKGAQMGMYLAASLLLRAGDYVIVADPGFFVVTQMFARMGMRVLRVKVDGEGMDIDAMEMLKEHLPFATFKIPTGGMCLWLTFTGVDTRLIAETASRLGLFIRDGKNHNPEGCDLNSMCIGFAALGLQDLQQATNLLIEAAKQAHASQNGDLQSA